MNEDTNKMTAPLFAGEVTLTERVVDGCTYHEAAARGWSTGPCRTADAAHGRLVRYFAGHRISEAAPMMASRAEMVAAQGLLDGRMRIRGMNYCAEPGELHSDAWIRASRQIESMKLYLEPEFVAATQENALIQLGRAS